MRYLIMIIVPIVSLMAAPSHYDLGKRLYFSKGCNGCHGVSAAGSTQYPPLAYRRQAFLASKLKNYRAKQGNTQQAELMIPFAVGLSDGEIHSITTFLSEYREGASRQKSDFSIKGDGGS